MRPPIRIAIADPHEIVRDSLKIFFEVMPDMLCVGEAASHREALNLCTYIQPDVILLEIDDNGDNVDVIREIRKRQPRTKVAVLTAHMEPCLVRKACEAGASAYLIKRMGIAELEEAIRAVFAGQRVFDPEVTTFLPSGGCPFART